MEKENMLRIPAKLEGMDVVLAFVSFLLDAHGCVPKVRTKIRMAVEELYVNVSLYAYPEADGWVEIRGGVEDGVAVFRTLVQILSPICQGMNATPRFTAPRRFLSCMK